MVTNTCTLKGMLSQSCWSKKLSLKGSVKQFCSHANAKHRTLCDTFYKQYASNLFCKDNLKFHSLYKCLITPCTLHQSLTQSAVQNDDKIVKFNIITLSSMIHVFKKNSSTHFASLALKLNKETSIKTCIFSTKAEQRDKLKNMQCVPLSHKKSNKRILIFKKTQHLQIYKALSVQLYTCIENSH